MSTETAVSEAVSRREPADDAAPPRDEGPPAASVSGGLPLTVIRPPSGWIRLNLREVWQCRDLLRLLIWRDIVGRYRQSIVGYGWAVIKPVLSMLIFTFIFGKVAKIPSDGSPYPLFAFAAILPWMYFSAALTNSTASVVSGGALLKKVYFPRLILPLVSVVGGLVELSIQLVVLAGLILYFHFAPPPATTPASDTGAATANARAASNSVSTDGDQATTTELAAAESTALLPWRFRPGWNTLAAPLCVLMCLLTALSAGLWLTALNVKYRDVGQAMPFVTQAWMWLSPIVYSSSAVPEHLRPIYGLNPMVGVIEGFRWSILGTTTPDWTMMAISWTVVAVMLFGGLVYFRRMETTFADVI